MVKKLTKFLVFIISFFSFLTIPRQILAAVDPPTTAPVKPTGIYNPALPKSLSDTSGPTFLQNVLQLGIRLFFVAGAIVFFFMLLIGGIKWISAGGDKARLESAQKQITHALVGLAILLSTFAIIKLVGYLFGIDLLKFTLPTL